MREQTRTIFVRGFDASVGEDQVLFLAHDVVKKGENKEFFFVSFALANLDFHFQIRSSLEEHFGSCGDISRISIPKDYETGSAKG